MPRPRLRRSLRSARSSTAVLVFLACYVVLLLVVSRFYLLPAHPDDPARRKVLGAHAALILVVLLFVLLLGLLLTFRISRFFKPRADRPAKPTKYVDAWAESGKRMKIPERDE